MSKDKGSKNHKKAPADKSAGKQKTLTDYQAGKKGNKGKLSPIEPFVAKSDKSQKV
mgnify:CR=1 FL=1